MNARLYDPLTARFLSADSLIPNSKDPLAYNRYIIDAFSIFIAYFRNSRSPSKSINQLSLFSITIKEHVKRKLLYLEAVSSG
jgi:hypothetical protein